MIPRSTFAFRLFGIPLQNINSSAPSSFEASSQPKEKPNQNLKNAKVRDQMSVSSHPVSRLRLIKLATRPDESERERMLRERRMELQAWNHQYWLANNSEFNQVRDLN